MRVIKASIVIAFVLGVFLSPNLWLDAGRFFPKLPPFDFLPTPGSLFDIVLLSAFIILSTIWVFYERRFIGWLAIGCLIMILIQDQMRWQPWVYLYLLMLIPYLVQSHQEKNERLILTALQWIIAGVYFWSGIHKLNFNFPTATFQQISNAFGVGIEFEPWKEFAYIVPVGEVLIAVALLTSKFRKLGIYGVILIHVAILLYLGPFGLDRNSIIYPWNLAMIVFVCLLFRGMDNKMLTSLPDVRTRFLLLVAIGLPWVFPFFNFFGYWDHYLSFSLYSNKTADFYVAIDESEIRKIDRRLEKYFAEIPGLQGGQLIVINKWAASDLNVPFYPELRAFEKLSDTFCDLGIDKDKLVFLSRTYSNGKSEFHKFTCDSLTNP